MKFIHTSDWHLGKTLEGNSRLEEQEMFLNDFVDIVEQKDIDMVIIAGDIYDTSNPPAAAEKLFYKTSLVLLIYYFPLKFFPSANLMYE